MKLFITDETNLSYDTLLGFLIYGGIVVDASESRSLVQELQAAKKDHGIPLDRPMKWNNEAWRGSPAMDVETHRQIKGRILNKFGESQSAIIVSLTPQNFYQTFDKIKQWIIDPNRQKTTLEYAMNTCLHKFDRYLNEKDDYGIAIADGFSGSDLQGHMTKHCFELFPEGGKYSFFKKIACPVMFTNDEYSELHQVNDVVLGSIQHSLKEITYNFLPGIKERFWCSDSSNPYTILGKGFDVYPKKSSPDNTLKIAGIKAKFMRLVSV